VFSPRARLFFYREVQLGELELAIGQKEGEKGLNEMNRWGSGVPAPNLGDRSDEAMRKVAHFGLFHGQSA
jgi:hypothetical protein